MGDRERIAHLLRRFGLGAGEVELNEYLPLGVQGTLDRLLNYEVVDEGFPISPWELAFDQGSDMVYLEPPRVATWWALRFLLTKRPLQEKLTLFWHDHFAVSAAKVEFGPMMLDYLEALRSNAAGRFEDLLAAVSTTPAMIRWLDTDASIKGHPNENFAREALELFTVGKGYTETDIRELARCFTGWGIRYLVFEQGGEKLQQTAKDSIASGRPMTAFAMSPSLHDDGEKQVLGQKRRWSGEEALRMLAKRPETALHLARKLWEFFAYPNPSSGAVEKVAAALKASDFRIRAALRAIAESEEFWSERCVRRQVKSPLDFTVALCRQFGLRDTILQLRGPATPTTPLAKPVRDAGGLVFGSMYQQGMLLLYPPDVGGWEWGSAWVTSANMSQRARFADLVFPRGSDQQPLAGFLNVRHRGAKSSAELVDGLLGQFDGPELPDKRALLIEACDRAGGTAKLSTPKEAADVYRAALKLLLAMPEFNLC